MFQSLVISRLAYALPAWGGFLKQSQVLKIDAFLSKAFRFGYTVQQTNVSDILADADTVLFNSAVHNVRHCLHSLLPTEKNMQMVLRKAHHFKLPNCHYKMFKNSFINRSVFKNCY